VTGWLRAVAAALLMLAAPLTAHTRSESYSTWTIAGPGAAGVYEVEAYRATQLMSDADGGDLNRALARHLAETVTLTQAGKACAPASPRPLAAQGGRLRVELRFRCAAPLETTAATLAIAAFRAESPSHVHYAVVSGADGRRHESLITASVGDLSVGGPAAEAPSDIPAFIRLGFDHVLSGADHLAFLLALALLAGTPGRAALAATGFTLGHSVTLALTALGLLHPDSAAIEAMIGFTVVYAAWEAMAERIGGAPRAVLAAAVATALLPAAAALIGHPVPAWPVYAGLALFAVCMSRIETGGRRWTPVLLAAGFGLAHGAGFAGALIELDLSPERLWRALLGFNIGVELAQLAALGVIGGLVFALRRTPERVRGGALAATCAALAMIGSYWFVSRTLG
jgi:hypothetical protein